MDVTMNDSQIRQSLNAIKVLCEILRERSDLSWEEAETVAKAHQFWVILKNQYLENGGSFQ